MYGPSWRRLGPSGSGFGGLWGRAGAGDTPKGARVKKYTFYEGNERFFASRWPLGGNIGCLWGRLGRP
eukprot:7585587-Pyramimonas_sp.AAC.1